jgi:Zn-dependent protease with chaperone function
MSNFSDSSQRGASPRGTSASASSQEALQAGLAALKQKNYREAIAQLESAHRGTTEPAAQLKAQIGLVKAYARISAKERAIALCQPLCNSTNPQVRAWATQTLEQLASPSSKAGSVAKLDQPDETGFMPLPLAPSAPADAIAQDSEDTTGFVPLNALPGGDREVVETAPPTIQPTEDLSELDTKINQPHSHLAPSTDLEAEETEAPDWVAANATIAPGDEETLCGPISSLPDATEETATPVEPGRSKAALAPIRSSSRWRQAGRVQKWATLEKVDRSKLWAAQVITVLVLFWLLRTLPPFCQVGLNWIVEQLSLHQLWIPHDSYIDPTWEVLLGLLILFGLSPWLLDSLLKRFYSLKSFSTAHLDQHSMEASRLLKRVCGQRRQPLPTLGLLPTTAPLALTYGYLPQNARIVVSQGLLDQLNDDEIATIYAAELGHITHWDFGVMSWVTLVAQIPYLLYWQAAVWGDRQQDRVLQSIAIVFSSLGYGLYWLCRLPGLWLSRMRLYYSDRTAAELTGNPNALVRALLKIAIGTAQDIRRWSYTSYVQEGFDLLTPVGHRSALSLGSIYAETQTPAILEWDRSNPFRRWLVVNNAHALLGDRLHLLTLYARYWKLPTELDWSPSPLRLPAANLKRLLLQGAPFFGSFIGLGIAGGLWLLGWIADKLDWLPLTWTWGDNSLLLGCALIGFGSGLILRINPSFPDIRRSNLQIDPALVALLSDPTALPIDSHPVRMQGKLLGRRGFGNWLHQDLLLQTATGLIRLHYTSQWGPLGNLFSQSLRPSALMNAPVSITGWFRRGATPWIDVETIQGQQGAVIRSKHPVWSTVLAGLTVLGGVYLIFLQGGI